jgi:hypothetical protein
MIDAHAERDVDIFLSAAVLRKGIDNNFLFLTLHPRQPLPGILDLGQAGVGVFLL